MRPSNDRLVSPPFAKTYAVLFLVLLGCVWFGSFLHIFSLSTRIAPKPKAEAPNATITQQQYSKTSGEAPRILYIVTSVAEYDNGQRNTQRGKDRYRDTLISVISESAHSMVSFGYRVDVYLIAHYEIQPERRDLLREQLPETVGFQVWDDATPLGYSQPGDTKTSQDGTVYVQPITRALSRQHRYVIKDKFFHYDLFVSFEDDMLVRGDHVQYYMEMTQELNRLKRGAPVRATGSEFINPVMDRFHGPLTRIQLARMIPGFIRVEVVSDANAFERDRQTHPVSLPTIATASKEAHLLDPAVCCHRDPSFLNSSATMDSTLRNPTMEDIFLWETQTIALGLHKMPNESSLDWIVLQQGIDQAYIPQEKIIGEYWAGKVLKGQEVERPNPTAPQYINNQGGWMGTQEQLFAWHRGHCKGQLLPPYNDLDGLKNNVEFWSGGISLAGMNSCQLQRIISLHPKDFSRQLVYHTSNNKQKSKNLAFTNVADFWKQLYSAQVAAESIIRSKR